jgi:hypothetical protein
MNIRRIAVTAMVGASMAGGTLGATVLTSTASAKTMHPGAAAQRGGSAPRPDRPKPVRPAPKPGAGGQSHRDRSQG